MRSATALPWRALAAAGIALAAVLAYSVHELRSQPAPPVPDALNGRRAAFVVEGSCPTPAYPALVRQPGDGGVVMLNFLVGVDGAVIESRVETSSGHPHLDEAALRALSRCRFHPGTLNGKPEESWHIMKYDWSQAH
jgi:protein TonB